MNIPTVEFGQQERTMADSDMFEDWRVVFSLDRAEKAISQREMRRKRSAPERDHMTSSCAEFLGSKGCLKYQAIRCSVLLAIIAIIKDDDRIGIRNRLEQDMARRAQGGRSTQAATGGQGTRPVRRPRKPVEPPDIGVLQVMVQRIDNLLKHAVEHPLLDASNIDFYPSRDMIPLIKLTRVFLNKLSRPTNNRPHPLLGMSPENLLAIIRSTVRVPGKVEKFLHCMDIVHANGSKLDLQKVFDILDALRRPINIIKLHLSQTVNTQSPQGSHPNFRDWLRVWDSHLCLSGSRLSGMPEMFLNALRAGCSFSPSR
ncbi:hypothetical protein PSHT_14000 [Puccinia striiformis]|uniref:Uncharacterized protein n=1 Tax=Puccinia striiformis TaxID=27350 RepID=A0A2S4UMY4_9BASI|nr:hypothetical protein PSHT_14000 [Puccinia striiformis]